MYNLIESILHKWSIFTSYVDVPALLLRRASPRAGSSAPPSEGAGPDVIGEEPWGTPNLGFRDMYILYSYINIVYIYIFISKQDDMGFLIFIEYLYHISIHIIYMYIFL